MVIMKKIMNKHKIKIVVVYTNKVKYIVHLSNLIFY